MEASPALRGLARPVLALHARDRHEPAVDPRIDCSAAKQMAFRAVPEMAALKDRGVHKASAREPRVGEAPNYGEAQEGSRATA